MIEPDISVVCDRNKINMCGCKGVLDLVIEILSLLTLRRDRFVKLRLYQRAKVREYWIVDSENKTVQIFLLEDIGMLCPYEDYGQNKVAKVNVLEGGFIELDKIFAEY